MIELSKDCLFTKVMDAASFSGTLPLDDDTDYVDTDDYDCCLFVIALGEVTNGSVITVQVKGSELAPGASGAVEVELGTALEYTASTASNKLLLVDVMRPDYRYLYANINVATQDAEVDSVVAIQYRSRQAPVTSSDVLSSLQLVDPTEAEE